MSKGLNIVIPMAGRGERFEKTGPPKPFIELNDKVMVERAIETLGLHGRYILVTRAYKSKELNKLKLKTIRRLAKYSHVQSLKVLTIDYNTEGPACSAMIAEKYINNDTSLVVANCDQIMRWDAQKFQNFTNNTQNDGILVTYYANTPKNSYAKFEKGRAMQVEEKKVISNHSLNGIHYWKRGCDFITSAKEMIRADDRVNNEFYISKTYNYLIKKGMLILNYHINKSEHLPVGTPEDLKTYLEELK